MTDLASLLTDYPGKLIFPTPDIGLLTLVQLQLYKNIFAITDPWKLFGSRSHGGVDQC